MKIKAVELDVEMSPPSPSSGFESKGMATDAAKHVASSLRGVVKAMANTTLNAVRDSIGANVDKVTLEFGVTVGGEAGVPFVTSGKADGSVKVKVECSFQERRAYQVPPD